MTCANCGKKVKAGRRGECPVCGDQVAPDVSKAFAATLRRAQEQTRGRGTDDRVIKAALLEPAYEEMEADPDVPDVEPDGPQRGVQGELSDFELSIVNKAAQSAGLDPVLEAEDLTPGYAAALRRLAFNVPAYAEGAGRLAARIDGS